MSSNEQRVFEVVRARVLDVLSDVRPEDVTIDKRLVDLGANSIDRVEVAITSMEELGLKIPRSALAGIGDLNGLVQLFCRHLDSGEAR